MSDIQVWLNDQSLSLEVAESNQIQVWLTDINSSLDVGEAQNIHLTFSTVLRGERGSEGPNSIAGYGFAIDSLSIGDVLEFGGSAWKNTSRREITDGGNF